MRTFTKDSRNYELIDNTNVGFSPKHLCTLCVFKPKCNSVFYVDFVKPTGVEDCGSNSYYVEREEIKEVVDEN
ncbi:MAG: hypothetical protein ACRCZ0_08600 [Cetobacterium sp.]